ncbi:MAG: hypothetical protein M1450_04450, partial [Patescibacteria group bacterium]|nr:hypothetical protein [Patescibacteria group bacterium]
MGSHQETYQQDKIDQEVNIPELKEIAKELAKRKPLETHAPDTAGIEDYDGFVQPPLLRRYDLDPSLIEDWTTRISHPEADGVVEDAELLIVEGQFGHHIRVSFKSGGSIDKSPISFRHEYDLSLVGSSCITGFITPETDDLSVLGNHQKQQRMSLGYNLPAIKTMAESVGTPKS